LVVQSGVSRQTNQDCVEKLDQRSALCQSAVAPSRRVLRASYELMDFLPVKTHAADAAREGAPGEEMRGRGRRARALFDPAPSGRARCRSRASTPAGAGASAWG